MSEMVERVAKAIHGHNEFAGGLSEAREVARTAIEAALEPTEAMISAGTDSFDWDSSDVNGSWFIRGADAGDCWRAMMKAALTDADPHSHNTAAKPAAATRDEP